MIFWVSWSGRGKLVPFFAIAAIVAGLTIAFFARAPGAGLGTVGPWPFAAGFIVVGALTLPLGFWWNWRSARKPVAPARHQFCSLPMQWWSILMIAFGALLLTDQESERQPRGTGEMPAKVLVKDSGG